MQFAGRFRLRAASATVELSRELFDEYDTLAIERVWAEWYKWAAKSAQPSLGLLYLEQCGWRKAYAELEALQECPQDPEWHPEGDVWTHTLLVTDAAASIAGRDGLVDDDRGVLVLAALTHDLGKPETTVVDGCRVRSPGHTDRLQTYERFLARIGCPRGIAERVVVLARHHMTHLDFAGSPRHVRRAARSLGEGGETIEMLARLVEADHSARPPLPGGMPEKMANMLEEARALAASESAPEPLLMGRHLLELGVLAGPGMGEILKAAYEAQLDGAFQVLEEAKVWVRKEFRL
jgi:tRNA nucleotidyltransferase (CCA-adding enzyme)